MASNAPYRPGRSASHGAQQVSCGVWVRSQHHGPGPAQGNRSAPRHATENATLLPSVGPLAGMLKTSTETGDLGVFSTKCRNAEPNKQRHVRSRAKLGDVTNNFSPTASRISGPLQRDVRGRLISHKDTESEIISMYGSDGHHSRGTSTQTPASDWRSYSMTTTGSRHFRTCKSPVSLQSQSSYASLLRPTASPNRHAARYGRIASHGHISSVSRRRRRPHSIASLLTSKADDHVRAVPSIKSPTGSVATRLASARVRGSKANATASHAISTWCPAAGFQATLSLRWTKHRLWRVRLSDEDPKPHFCHRDVPEPVIIDNIAGGSQSSGFAILRLFGEL